jgi:hypothetical protein
MSRTICSTGFLLKVRNVLISKIISSTVFLVKVRNVIQLFEYARLGSETGAIINL